MVSNRALAPLMIGRQAQLRELEEHLAQARRGAGLVVLVAGEAGIGKTRLLREFTRRLDAARGAGAIDVLEGHCYDEEPAVPYGPFVELLRLLAQASGPEALAQLAGPLAGDLARLIPELAPARRPDAGDPQLEKRRLFEAIYRALRPRDEQGCRIVILEDLHWSDQSSQELIHYLARAIERDRVLIIGSYRTDELHRRHPLTHLIARLARDRLHREVRLAPLARGEFAHLLESALGRPLPESFVDALFERTEGNPFFGEEVLESLIEHAQLETLIEHAQFGRRVDKLAIPLSIQDSILRRSADLDQTTAAALSFAAVIGRRFDFDLLLRLTGLDEADLVRALALLVERQLIVEEPGTDDGYRFRHELIRETVAAGLLRRERRMMHRAVLEALESHYGDDVECVAEQLAYHSLQARALPQAARYARMAGDRAMSLHAYREAAAHYEAALEADENGDPLVRADLLASLGHAAYPLGDFRRCSREWREALSLYRRLGERRKASDIERWLGQAAWELDDEAAAFAHTRAALECLEDEPPCRELAMAYSALSRLYMLTGKQHEAIVWGKCALELGETLGDAGVRSHALNNIGVALVEQGEHALGLAKLEESLALARQAALPTDMLRAYSNLGGMLSHIGQVRRAAEVMGEGIAVARQIGWEMHCTALREKLAFVDLALGRFDRVREHIEALRRTGGPLMPSGPGHQHIDLLEANLLARQGQPEAAREILRRVQPETLDRGDCITFEWGVASCYTLLGDAEHALAAAERGLGLLAQAEKGRPRLKGLLPFVEALVVGGAADRARSIVESLDETSATPAERATLADLRGLLEPAGDAAAGHFALAAETWRQLGMPFEEARARRRRAEALLRGDAPGSRADAARELELAREQAAAIGAALELEAIDELRRQVSHPGQPLTLRRAPAAGHLGALTPRERQVLGLIARGHSNRAIAEALVISEKTVETHVSNILGKLSLQSRTQAAAYALEHGIVAEAA